MFYVINSETKQIRSFAGRSSQFPYRKVAEKYAAKANRYGYHDAKNHYVVMSAAEFNAVEDVRVTRKVQNLMTGQMVDEDINTPYCCSVASESYWSN